MKQINKTLSLIDNKLYIEEEIILLDFSLVNFILLEHFKKNQIILKEEDKNKISKWILDLESTLKESVFKDSLYIKNQKISYLELKSYIYKYIVKYLLKYIEALDLKHTEFNGTLSFYQVNQKINEMFSGKELKIGATLSNKKRNPVKEWDGKTSREICFTFGKRKKIFTVFYKRPWAVRFKLKDDVGKHKIDISIKSNSNKWISLLTEFLEVKVADPSLEFMLYISEDNHLKIRIIRTWTRKIILYREIKEVF